MKVCGHFTYTALIYRKEMVEPELSLYVDVLCGLTEWHSHYKQRGFEILPPESTEGLVATLYFAEDDDWAILHFNHCLEIRKLSILSHADGSNYSPVQNGE